MEALVLLLLALQGCGQFVEEPCIVRQLPLLWCEAEVWGITRARVGLPRGGGARVVQMGWRPGLRLVRLLVGSRHDEGSQEFRLGGTCGRVPPI